MLVQKSLQTRGYLSVLMVFSAIGTPVHASDTNSVNDPKKPSYLKADPSRFGAKDVNMGATNRPVEYVLTTNGVLQAAPTEVINGNVPQNDTVSDRVSTGDLSSLGQDKVGVPIVRTPTKSDEDIDNAELKCGPSPLSVAEIKSLVVKYARIHNVDETFALAIASTESSFDRKRNSPAGARGPMQLMPATAERYNVKDICDPEQNIEGGMKYIRFLLDEFGNPLYAAAGYNAGENRIYEYQGIPPFTETVNYVAKIVNYQLGFDPVPKSKKQVQRKSTVKAGPQIAAPKAQPQAKGIIGNSAKAEWKNGVLQF